MTVGFVGIDLGGTSMKIGVVNQEGKILAQNEEPTLAEEGAYPLIDRMATHIRKIVKNSPLTWEQIHGIGLGLPGFLDLKRGIVVNLTNLHLSDFPIVDVLEKKLQKRVVFNNDANVAALGESWTGAGAGMDDLICVTIGTGVGGGIITNGQLTSGARGFAGEIGHIHIESEGYTCNCGNIGCLETVASATGMVRVAKDLISNGHQTILTSTLTTEDIFHSASQGDPVGTKTLNRAIQALARAFAQLSVILNPQRFVIGGGVVRAGDALLIPLREAYLRVAQKHASQGVEIVPAILGNQAGIVGAAGLLALAEQP